MSRLLRCAFVLVFGTLLLAGCETSQRLDALEKQSKELQGQLDRGRNASDYDLQSKCAKEAKQWFNENWVSDKSTILLTYSDHYNKRLNKCFIFVEFHSWLGSSTIWANNMNLWDVQENSKYGEFIKAIISTHLVAKLPTISHPPAKCSAQNARAHKNLTISSAAI